MTNSVDLRVDVRMRVGGGNGRYAVVHRQEEVGVVERRERGRLREVEVGWEAIGIIVSKTGDYRWLMMITYAVFCLGYGLMTMLDDQSSKCVFCCCCGSCRRANASSALSRRFYRSSLPLGSVRTSRCVSFSVFVAYPDPQADTAHCSGTLQALPLSG